jgi:DNA-binding transcriptional LysR family regulator
MEIYQLRTFLTVARLGHLTRAAEQLHISQPAVSKQLKALEEELGVVLFERTPAGMVLTRPGQMLLEHAEKTLASAMELVNLAQRIRGEVTGAVRLGTIIDPEFLRLGAVLGRLLARHPQIDVKLAHGISGTVLERLRAGAVDAGFYLGELADPAIDVTPLCTLNYVVVAPAAWAGRIAGAGWADIAGLPWIGTPAHSSQHRLVADMFAEHGMAWSSVVEVDQEASMRSLVAMGVGLCLLREDVAQEAARHGQMVVWPGARRACPLSLIHLKGRAGDALVDALRQAVLEAWA